MSQQQGSTPGGQGAPGLLAAQQARPQHAPGSRNEQAAPVGAHGGAAWQTPLRLVAPLPVPPTQLFEQHWPFFVHALPLTLHS